VTVIYSFALFKPNLSSCEQWLLRFWKCCAGERWRSSVEPIVRKMKHYKESRKKVSSYIR